MIGAPPKAARVLALALTAAVFSACESVTDVTSDLDPQFTTTSDRGEVRLQKRGPEGTTATFSIAASGGTLPVGSSITLDACEVTPCPSTLVWYGDATEEITITETSFTGDVILERIRVGSTLYGITNYFWPEDPTVTFEAGPGNNVQVLFKNIGETPNGEAGCTPGFWRQDQHFAYWTEPYTPSTMFGAVFDDAFPGQTLLDVVWARGGGLDALGRHTVAALLNAASPTVDYGMTPADVISAFNSAYASGDYETQKDTFEGLNERGCTAKD